MTNWVNNYSKEGEFAHLHADHIAMRETKDCTVFSFATVWKASYRDAHRHLKRQFLRPNRKGPQWRECEMADKLCPKTKMTKHEYTRDNSITLGQFCKKHPTGRHWVFVRGHALAVIDGVVYDHSHKLKRKVFLAWEVHV